MTLDDQIRSRVEAFVSELTGMIRQAAADAAVSALTGNVVAFRPRGKPGPKPGLKAPGAAPKASGKRVRRTEAQIQQTMTKVVAFIDAHPGSRSEDIRASVGVSAPVMADTLRRLVSEKQVKSKGQRRGMTYTRA